MLIVYLILATVLVAQSIYKVKANNTDLGESPLFRRLVGHFFRHLFVPLFIVSNELSQIGAVSSHVVERGTSVELPAITKALAEPREL